MATEITAGSRHGLLKDTGKPHEERVNTVVKELVARDGKRKVEIFRRDDGSFGFAAFKFSDESRELCWIPYGRFAECFANNEQTAESEAHSRVDWLRGNGG